MNIIVIHAELKTAFRSIADNTGASELLHIFCNLFFSLISLFSRYVKQNGSRVRQIINCLPISEKMLLEITDT